MEESMNERIVQIAILTIVNYLHSHLKNYHTEAILIVLVTKIEVS